MERYSFTHLLSAVDITKGDIEMTLTLADYFKAQAEKGHKSFDIAKGTVLASLFFEPSTRTRFSFESAMYRLGGHVMSMESSLSSSTQKGETLSDTGRIISGYADIVVFRHPLAGSAKEFASHSTIPVINAGDGANQHPSQSFLDLYAIHALQSRFDGLHIGFVGDLKYGRTINSLIHLMSFYTNVTFYFISHPSLLIDRTKIDEITALGHTVIISEDLDQAIPQLDVLYMTRIQQERFPNPEEFESVKSIYTLTPEMLTLAKPTLSILHPLPRVTEITPEVDILPSAQYFNQARWGLYVRMALITRILNLTF